MDNVSTRFSDIWGERLLSAKLFRAYPFQYMTPQPACQKMQSIEEGALSGNSLPTLSLKHAIAGEDAPVPKPSVLALQPFFVRTRRATKFPV